MLLVAVVSWGELGVAPAAAHTELRSSNPVDGQRVAVAPETVELVFGEPVVDDSARVVARPSPGGQPRELAVDVDGVRVSATVPGDLSSGPPPSRAVWTVSYRVVSDDGHPITGQLRFTVVPKPRTGATLQPSPVPSVTLDSEDSAPAVRELDQATGGGDQALFTVVMGLLAAATTVGLTYLLARRRSRGEQP